MYTKLIFCLTAQTSSTVILHILNIDKNETNEEYTINLENIVLQIIANCATLKKL